MNFISKFCNEMIFLWKDREGFFKKKAKEKKNWKELLLIYVILVIGVILSGIIEQINSFGIFVGGGIVFIGLVSLFIGLVSYILIMHGIMKLFGSKTELFRTAQAAFYGIAFGWVILFFGNLLLLIPAMAFVKYVIILGSIAGWGMTLIGLKEYHKIRLLKAAALSIFSGLIAIGIEYGLSFLLSFLLILILSLAGINMTLP